MTFTAPESGTYYARVSGDRDETGTYTLSVTDVTPEDEEERPAKPTGLSATASHDSVTLTWDDPNDDSVKANTSYTYRIKAINEYGVSHRSRWFHIDTLAAPQETVVEGDDQDEQGGDDDAGGAPGHATPPGSGKRANVAEPDGEDLPLNTTTRGRVKVRGSATGTIGQSGDIDWFRVDLEAGKRYQFDLEGEPTERGTLEDPFLGLYDDSSNTIVANDDASGTTLNSQIVHTATATRHLLPGGQCGRKHAQWHLHAVGA